VGDDPATQLDDQARFITLEEFAERLGLSVGTLHSLRRTAADGREFYDILGTPVRRVHYGGRSKVRVPLPDVIAAVNAACAS
jgi:hypothetical protein